ncbi:MAG: Asp-tRNA(Asn)/Glu-tRNA(Gln) amidotransferase subunit GatA [bacterium]|nr:Asp-tRNA(Asn)/Glu-tRNA(Gln) amidotransferase subunit GatA [bacterium]
MLNELTITQAREGLDKKKFSSVEITKACLDRIRSRNGKINAYITVFEESALKEADIADNMIAKGHSRDLTGIPFCVKDAICTKDGRATGGAKILNNYVPPYDATVISKIRKQGAVLLGKNNCDAFGHGASNENSMYGPVLNPHDGQRVAGGSSGGSAAAVADNMCIFSIAEDTGGSIRQPASFCGVVGLRPSYGRNSRYGIMPMASSLDTVGPITKSVRDLAIVQRIIAGLDIKDSTTVSNSVPEYERILKKSVEGLRIGVPKEYFEAKGMDNEVKSIIEARLKDIKNLGCEIVKISLPHTKYAIPVYYLIVPSEDSSNLGRLDGIRYGVQAKADNLYDVYTKSRAQGFPEEVKRRIMIGTYALSAGYYEAYYRKAQKVRTLICRDFDTVFNEVDLLVTPTSPFPAFKIGEKKDDIISMYLADIFVSASALAGIPGLSIPAGKTKSGLPVGLQILGPRLFEGKVMQLGYAIERV